MHLKTMHLKTMHLKTMFLKTKPWIILMLVSSLLLLASCSSTKLVSSWHKPEYSAEPVKRVLILGVMHTDLQRRTIEDAFVQRLAKESVTGIAGYTLMSNPDDYDEIAEIREAVHKSVADAALIITLVEDKEQERYVPPSVDYVPSYGMGYGFYNYYGRSYQAVYRPGYKTIDQIVKLEATLFLTDTKEMIWAGATESFNPSSADSVARENTNLIVESMKKASLIN
jgi:hypothetical protein